MLELRPYQTEIIKSIIDNGNTLVILPTGTGKTLIAFNLMIDINPCLMLAPTKPLSEQHYKNFIKFYEQVKEKQEKERKELNISIITGEIKQEKREQYYKADIIFATPQTVKNDLETLDKGLFKLIVFDEAHRAVGNYAYTLIAKYFESALIIGLTASPGSDKERIKQIIDNLRIKNIEIRTEKQLKDYLADKTYQKIFIELPDEMKDIINSLKKMANEYKEKLLNIGIYVPNKKSEFIKLGNKIMSSESKAKFGAFPYYIALLHLLHMLELIETQGLNAFLAYANKLKEEKKVSVRKLVTADEFINVLKKADEAVKKGIDHPKIDKLIELLKLFYKGQVIVFVQYTEQINRIIKILEKNGINAKPFMGKKHFSKEQQKTIMEDFKQGKFKVLVSSSIGEEGIDIPEVSAVIFYEAVPSAIRAIQRKGRTGRVKAGSVVFLIAKNTRDESYFYAATAKERKMLKIIEELKTMIKIKEEKSKINKANNVNKLTKDEINKEELKEEKQVKDRNNQRFISDWL